MKREIINSKEYEQCYPELGAIKSIHDRKGVLSVYVNAQRYEDAPEFIRRKFKDMLLREWSELDWGPEIEIRDATDKYLLFYSEWSDEETNTRVILDRPGVRKWFAALPPEEQMHARSLGVRLGAGGGGRDQTM
jgi:hypothetical protein